MIGIILTIVLSWLFLLILVLYILSFQFPVFFRQLRVGKDERIFSLLKFRTLKNTHGTLQERRFFMGDMLRYVSLDELPQVWNVIKGEMSMVGPRPLPIEYLQLYSSEQRLRHMVRPGLTGWAQVNGRHSISWKEKFDFDIYYIRNVSFWFDLIILLKTIFLFFKFKRDVSLTEKPFTGNG